MVCSVIQRTSPGARACLSATVCFREVLLEPTGTVRRIGLSHDHDEPQTVRWRKDPRAGNAIFVDVVNYLHDASCSY